MNITSLMIPMLLAVIMTAAAILGAGVAVAVVYLAARKAWPHFLNYTYVLVACAGVFLLARYLQSRERLSQGNSYKATPEYLGYGLTAPVMLMFLPEPLRRARKQHRHTRHTRRRRSTRQ